MDGEPRSVAEMRIYFDRQVPDGADGFENRGGFRLNASLWGERAEQAAAVLPKGARVYVTGTLVQDTWQDKDTGAPRERLELSADYVSLDLGRVEGIRVRTREAG